MNTALDRSMADATTWLRHGHACEAEGTPPALADAVRAYDAAIASLSPLPLDQNTSVRRDLGGAWMNRGNALQKLGTPASLHDSVRAYDQAIALLQLLPVATHPPHLNCLGSAWMNRGHALLQLGTSGSLALALASHEAAVVLLRGLPIGEIPAYRLNLAGAELNLANALLLAETAAMVERAQESARAALALAAGNEEALSEFADLGLKARRALCEAIGQLLFAFAPDQAAVARLASEASDAVDTGLALARRWEERDVPHFRPVAVRLFRFGAQLYQLHQPHFLAEFLLENLDPAAAPAAWVADAEFQEIAATTLARAQAALEAPRILAAGDAASERALALFRTLADATAKLAPVSR